ncbi:MAG: hypothetical protein AAF654_14500 [Myxococcota bacterium]
MADERERRDGFVLGMMTKIYFNPKHGRARGTAPRGVELDILKRYCRLPAPLFNQSLASLVERGMVAQTSDRHVYVLTANALNLIQNGWQGDTRG